MKKRLPSLSAAPVLFCFSLVMFFAWSQNDLEKHPSCHYCGMDRTKFAHSRMFIQYNDGTTVGTCSLHCAAMDLALKIGKSPDKILVGDLNQKILIDAEKCYWVIGGNKVGVMTKRAKWAFAEESEAASFVSAHGGSIANFETAMKAAFEDMFEDVRMIREKREKRRLEMREHQNDRP